MQLYPGVAPLTIIASGAVVVGDILTSGASDPHGWFPGPLTVEGNDPRSAANLMAAVEAVTDRINWLGWRVLDIWGGGDYSAATGPIKVGGFWTFEPPTGGPAISVVAATASFPAVTVAQTGTGAAAELIQSGTGAGLVVNVEAASTAAAAVSIANAGSGHALALSGNGELYRNGIPDLPNGPGAYRALRVQTAPTTSATIDATAQEILVIPAGLAVVATYTLATPPHSVRLTITASEGYGGGTPVITGATDPILDNNQFPAGPLTYAVSKVYFFDTVSVTWLLESSTGP